MEGIKEKEERLKKSAEKQGYILMKSKQGYMIVDYYTSRIIAGHEYSYSIEDAERFLAD
jgi:hypothetical protein